MSDIELYRARARGWLEQQAPTFGAAARRNLTEAADVALSRRWQAAKADAGYAGIAWPQAHGGQGLTVLEKLAFEQEQSKHGFPNLDFDITLGMPVPMILRYGPPGWREERAKAALRGDEIWCQLFSEPSGGSDLAGIRLRAEWDGEAWVLNGQKAWTSYAHIADYGVILARTDPAAPKHRGLTYFWLDMKCPGVTVRRIKLMDGHAPLNEVFFEDVRIADSQRMGPVGGGFGLALETLVIERYTAADPDGFGPPLDLFVGLARACEVNGRPALEDGRVRQQIARNYAMRNALVSIHKRALLSLQAGVAPGPEGALHKLVAVRSRQKLSEFAIDLQGAAGVAQNSSEMKQDWVASWLGAPRGRIGGGADEMLLNTIAEKILGLPQDYRPDKSTPFNQIP